MHKIVKPGLGTILRARAEKEIIKMKRLEPGETPDDEESQLRAARIGVISNVAIFAAIILFLKTGNEIFTFVLHCTT